MDEPHGLSERGSELWGALTKGRALDAPQAVLAAEACRVADRLEKLDQLLRGDVDVWVRITEGREGDDLVLAMDGALSEARQQQNALRQILTTLGVEKVKAGASKTGGGGVDEIAQRAARRRAAASGSVDSSTG